MTTSVKLMIHKFTGEETPEEFPIKEGARCKLDIAIFDNLNLKDKVDSVVLTLLKKDEADTSTTSNTIYSLSIKLKKDTKIDKNIVTENIYGKDKFIYTTDTTVDNINKLYDLQDAIQDFTHILIIGNINNVTDLDFTSIKTIFVTNIQITAPQSIKSFKESLNIQEFLNLRYIDYFSFDNIKFNELYNETHKMAGGNSKKIKNKSK
jgi:hypothetical protein